MTDLPTPGIYWLAFDGYRGEIHTYTAEIRADGTALSTMPYDTHSRLSTLIMSAACFVAGHDDAQRLLTVANRFWSRGDDADRDAVLDCAQYLAEAVKLRLAGNIQLALRRERSAERILVLWDV